MDRDTEKVAERLKCVIREAAAVIDLPSAMDLMSELADWSYRQYEELLIDDEPEDIDYDE